jgi:hypothetical protein
MGIINSFSSYISVEILAEKIENQIELDGGFLQD